MKKSLLILLTLFALQSLVFSQQAWQWQNPWPQGNDLRTVWVFDSLTMLAGGDNGTMLKTTDRGLSWRIQYIQPGNYVSSLHFIDRKTGWAAVATYGTIQYVFKTTNQGDTWSIVSEIDDSAFPKLFFVNERCGWMVGCAGDQIFRTTDGGTSWTHHSLDSLPQSTSEFFVDSLTGWVVGIGAVIGKTTDGGNTWQQQFLDRSNVEQLLSVCFVDDSTGWTAGSSQGQPYVANTTNGGLTWQTQFAPNVDDIVLDIAFADQHIGAAISSGGMVYSTTDGGVTWSFIQTPSRSTKSALLSICFSDKKNGWAAGEKGYVYQSKNGGENWQEMSHGSRATLNSVQFIDSLNGFATGVNGIVLITTDGGTTWSSHVIDSLATFNHVTFSSRSTWWVVGVRLLEYYRMGELASSHDGGMSWDTTSFPGFNGFVSIDFADEMHGWILGQRGYNRIVFKTTNGGANWLLEVADTLAYASLTNSIKFIDTLDGWIAGVGTTLLNTIDGGVTWTEKSNGIVTGTSDLCFFNRLRGWAVGGSEVFYEEPAGGYGDIWYTSDGGGNWILQDGTALDDYTALSCPDSLNGWAVGYRGLLHHTSDAGIHWSPQQIPFSRSFYSVGFIGPATGWICGDNGAIFKTTNGGITSVGPRGASEGLPPRFALLQNYPNPFNPSTVIEFDLPRKDFVSLDLYDILGQKVRSITSGTLDAGRHSVRFNDAGLPSGVYFYRLLTNTGILVRKMLILQ